MRNTASRLNRLEAAIAPRRRKFCLFDNSNYDPKFDLAVEVQRLCDERGMTDGDELHLFRWLGPNERPR
jgi:hypothetical protein